MGRQNANEQMDVICGAVDDQSGSAHFADYASEISKRSRYGTLA